jgi:hypothetical protein
MMMRNKQVGVGPKKNNTDGKKNKNYLAEQMFADE